MSGRRCGKLLVLTMSLLAALGVSSLTAAASPSSAAVQKRCRSALLPMLPQAGEVLPRAARPSRSSGTHRPDRCRRQQRGTRLDRRGRPAGQSRSRRRPGRPARFARTHWNDRSARSHRPLRRQRNDRPARDTRRHRHQRNQRVAGDNGFERPHRNHGRGRFERCVPVRLHLQRRRGERPRRSRRGLRHERFPHLGLHAQPWHRPGHGREHGHLLRSRFRSPAPRRASSRCSSTAPSFPARSTDPRPPPSRTMDRRSSQSRRALCSRSGTTRRLPRSASRPSAAERWRIRTPRS